jgi:GxxExxY protein
VGRLKSIEECARLAVDCGFWIHQQLGPGLLESVYEAVLELKLKRLGLFVQRQLPVPISFEGVVLQEGFRIDLLVERSLVIEVKSVEKLLPVHGKQLLTYLRLTEQLLGLLMNFGNATFREGLKRVVNGHVDFASSRLRVHKISAPSPD